MRITVMASMFATLAFSSTAEAYSGFVKNSGSGYVKLSFNTFASNDFYDTSGELSSFGSEFSQQNLSLYAEYGVLDFLTVGIDAPLLRLNSFETSDTAAGVGDLTLFAKVGTSLAGFRLSLTLAPEFPVGRSEALVDTAFADIRSNLPTGDGEFNVWTRVAVSRTLPTPNAIPSYASVYFGHNLRTEFADQLEVGGEVGVSLWGWVWLQGRLTARFTPTSTENLKPEGIFLFGEGTEYVAAGGSLSVRVPETPLWAHVDVAHTFANLRNLYAGTTVGAGLSVDW